MRQMDERRIRLAYHEAGHAVAGVLLGGRVRLVELRDDGNTAFAHLPASADARAAYAGPWAQARVTAHRHPGPLDVHRALMTTGCHDNKVLTAAGGPAAGSAVVGLLTRHWGAVRNLAQVLYRDGTASHADVLAALGVTDGGGPHSAQIAGLRMGT